MKKLNDLTSIDKYNIYIYLCVCIFHLKGRGDRVLPFTYLDSPMAEFSYFFLFSLIFAIFRGKKQVKDGRNMQTLVFSVSVKS